MERLIKAENPRSLFINKNRGQIGYKMRAYWGKLGADPIETALDVYIDKDGEKINIGKFARIEKNGQFYHDGVQVSPFVDSSVFESISFAVYYEYNGSLIEIDYTDKVYSGAEASTDGSDYMRNFDSIEDAKDFLEFEVGDVATIKGNLYKVVTDVQEYCDESYAILISQALQLVMVDGVIEKEVTIRVGTSSPYKTLEEAINKTMRISGKITINLEAGYDSGSIEFNGLDLSKYTINSVDAKVSAELKLNHCYSPAINIMCGVKALGSYINCSDGFGDNYKANDNPTANSFGKHEYKSSVVTNSLEGRFSTIYSGGYNVEVTNSQLHLSFFKTEDAGFNVYNSDLRFYHADIERGFHSEPQTEASTHEQLKINKESAFNIDSSIITFSSNMSRCLIRSCVPIYYYGGCKINGSTRLIDFEPIHLQYNAFTNGKTYPFANTPPFDGGVLYGLQRRGGSLTLFGDIKLTMDKLPNGVSQDIENKIVTYLGDLYNSQRDYALPNINYWTPSQDGSYEQTSAIWGGSCSQ